MSDRGSQSQSSTLPYDTNALLSLYGMSSGLYGAGGGSGPGGGGGGGGQPGWWGMAAGQLAVQDYLSRVQAAAQDPAQPGGQAGKGRKHHSDGDTSFQHLKLPSDTEIVPTGANSRTKSTELESSSVPSVSIPNIPPGLTIERKKPGRKPLDPNYHLASSGQVIDRVEITKIPLANGSSATPLDMSSKARTSESSSADGEAPLNLSMRPESETPVSLTTKRKEEAEKDGGQARSKIPSDYYASQALSGVFLAEQIRQQQLASELQNHLQNSNSSLAAMQALLSLGGTPANGAGGGETKRKQSDARSSSKNLGRGNNSIQPKKNTVASMLAQARGDTLSLHPELTIEPIYKPSEQEGQEFDQSKAGRRLSTYIDSEGKLQIKTVCESPEIRNLSERDSEEGIGSDSDQPEDGSTSSKGKRYYATEDDDLGAPIQAGWRRETTIREYTKSGIRGEVVYVAPCGKRFKQYPDIIRYLEKRHITSIRRENFSFSTKLIIGDFLRPSGETDDNTGEEKYVRLTEEQMKDEIDKVRKENGWKPRKRIGPLRSREGGRRSNGDRGDAHNVEDQYKLLQRLQVEAIEREKRRRDEQEQIKLQKEALRVLKEAEKRDKLENAKREKEAKQQLYMEEKKRRQEEKIKKLQELELKRQQNAMIKEQERERRRQHMMLVKQLDGKKRNDERKRNMEKMRVEKEKEKERRTETKRLEMEILTEMRKPVEDMALPDSKQLPELQRIEKLKLSGEAFANILMVFEFLHNFGETLGFDMESLPNMTSFQSALLNDDPESEEELLSVISHLVVCAVEDPGVPMPLKTLTILGQNLRQADITNTNLSEILRLFIQARAMAEVKLFHGAIPPEPKDRKEAIQDLFLHADEGYLKLLASNKTYILSQHLKEKPFLSLNPTLKSEIVAFLCNELLSNKAVVNQIEVTMENTHVMKRKKFILENKVKKLRILHNRKYKLKTEAGKLLEDSSTNASNSNLGDSECQSETGDDKDDVMSVVSESNCDTPTTKNKGKKKSKRGLRGKRKLDEELEEEPMEESDTDDLSDIDDEKEEDEEDITLSAEDLQKKIERLTKLSKKKSEDFTFVNNTLRATDLGQDRYRRRYWHLAYAGGIFVEALESAEPWKLETRGLTDLEYQQFIEKKEEKVNDEVEELKSPSAKKIKLDEELVKQEEEEKENKAITPSLNILSSTPKCPETEAALSRLGRDILVTPKTEVKNETIQSPKVTPNGSHLNLINHSTYFNMSLSPLVLNGSVVITAREGDKGEKPWFNLLAREETSGTPAGQDQQAEKAEIDFHPGRVKSQECDGNTQLTLLEKKLEIVKQMNKESSRLPIPLEKCYGWWKLSEDEIVSQIESAALQKGTREQNLVTNIRKGLEVILESSKKVPGDEIDILDDDEYHAESMEKITEIVPGASRPEKCSEFSRDVAIRCEKYILEQVEALEDKVATASMQVPGCLMLDRPLIDNLNFRASCEEESETGLDPVEVGRSRLLELEAAIERRYLKAPLGFSHEVTLKKITTKKEEGEEEMEIDDTEENQENGNIENCDKAENGLEVAEESQELNPEDNEDDKDENSDEKKKAKVGLPRGLVTWREAVKNAKNAAQLAMAFYVLETSIAWDKSIMKASCQFCHGGENENALLLCDGCDKGYHTYCFKPPITKIPEGDWYCYECINKATGEKHCLVCGEQDGNNLIHCSSCPRAYHTNCINPNMSKTPRGKWRCPGCNGKAPKKKFKRPSQILSSAEDGESTEKTPNTSQPDTSSTTEEKDNGQEQVKVGKKKGARSAKIDKDISICQTILSELSGHEDSWPFLTPVNTKQFPTYKKIIRVPMDISTIRKKLNDGIYKGRDEFKDDVSLIFQNCQIFNEDDSPVGKCGRNMKGFFQKRWTDLTT